MTPTLMPAVRQGGRGGEGAVCVAAVGLLALCWLERAGELDRADLVAATGPPGPHLTMGSNR